MKKALLLCAGEGTRLRPLTFSKPKHLLPVAGKPLLGWALEAIAQAGLTDVGIVVGHRWEAVQSYVGNGTTWGLNVSYIKQEQPLGLAHAVKQGHSFVADEPFLVYLGDNLLEYSLSNFVAAFQAQQNDAALLLKAVQDPRRYGVAVLDERKHVKQLMEKPSHPPSPWAIVGVYAFTPAIFEAIDCIQPSARGELEITDAIQTLIEQGKAVQALVMDGYWLDAGEPMALLEANRIYLERVKPKMAEQQLERCHITGAVAIESGTHIFDCELQGPCVIGHNCRIEQSYIGPYVAIGDGCNIRACRIKNGIIQSQSRLEYVALEESVIGEHVHVTGHADFGKPLHMILGDMAQIRML